MMLNPMLAPNKYKTTLCRHFSTMGSCSMGARCHFAHGNDELRSANDPLDPNAPVSDPAAYAAGLPPLGVTNFKSIKCRYFELGICKYSEGCHFNHGEADKTAGMDQSSLNQMVLAQQYAALLQQQEKLQGETKAIEAAAQQKQNEFSGLGTQQQASQYTVQKDPIIQKEILGKQLKLILNGIDEQQDAEWDQEEIYRIKLSKTLFNANNLNGCALTLNDMMFGKPVSEDRQKLYDKFVNESSDLAVNLMAEYSVKYQKEQEEAKKQAEAMQQQQQQPMMMPTPNLLAPINQPVVMPQSVPPQSQPLQPGYY